MNGGGILALDLGRKTGWAYAEPPAAPVFGASRFDGDGPALFVNFERWLTGKLSGYQPAYLAIEAPFVQNPNNVAILYGLAAVAELLGWRADIPPRNIERLTIAKIRAHFLGANPKRKEAKRQTIENCRLLGWEVPGDDAADACAMLSYAAARYLPQDQHYPAALFGRVVA